MPNLSSFKNLFEDLPQIHFPNPFISQLLGTVWFVGKLRHRYSRDECELNLWCDREKLFSKWIRWQLFSIRFHCFRFPSKCIVERCVVLHSYCMGHVFVAVEFQIGVNDNYFSRAITLAIRLGSCEVSAFRSGVAIWLFPSSSTDAAKGLRLLFQLFQDD